LGNPIPHRIDFVPKVSYASSVNSPALLTALALGVAVVGCKKHAGNAPDPATAPAATAKTEVPENDFKEAAEGIRPLAEEGDAEAQSALGIFYVNGRGVPRDYVEAYKWLKLASDKGDKDAKTAFGVIDKLMTSSEIAEGKKRADAFVPKKTAVSQSNSKP
jgi:TPR repeat protein